MALYQADQFQQVEQICNAIDSCVIKLKCYNGIEDKSIETTKSNKLEHGFGLKIINTITDKYDGMLKIDCDDKWFTTSVLIYKYKSNI